MRRGLIIALFAAVIAVGASFAMGAGSGPAGTTYKIELDSAFGLVKGADFKVAGVAVGSISNLDVTPEARALVEVEVSDSGGAFGGLRDSAECMVAPQSLIGEYFVDCQPGEKGELLKSGATVPVEQTRSPIPPDLVLNVMRKPVRERFRIVLGELGIGFAARGDDVAETIRRAIPAFGATSDVLEVLAQRRETLAGLARDSGQVLQVLGRRRDDVTDFVSAAADASEATAARSAEVGETFRRFPGFLDELEPTMNDLALTSRRLTPALADLRVAAPAVTSLLDTLRPFSQVALPAVESLGETSETGQEAAREAASLVEELRGLGQSSPEPAQNLAVILRHLDNRKFAVEDDPDSPGGKGYTGLEAPLQYIFDQSLAANIFDQRGYTLKLNLTVGECTAYEDAEGALANPEKYERCNQNLGPDQPGITTPDPGPGAAERSGESREGRVRDEETTGQLAPDAPSATASPVSPVPTAPGGEPLPDATAIPLEPVQDLVNKIPELLDPVTGGVDDAVRPLLGGKQDAKPTEDLLDYLLG